MVVAERPVGIDERVGAAVDLSDEASLHNRLMAAGISPLDPEYVRSEKRRVLRQVWPRVIGGAWLIPYILAVANNLSAWVLLVAPAFLLPVLVGHGFLACAGLALAGLVIGVVLLAVLVHPLNVLGGWLTDLCARSSTRWARVPEPQYRPWEFRLPAEPEAIKTRAFLSIPGVRFEVEYPHSTRQAPDPFLIAIVDHEDGVPEECYIAQWE